MTMTSQKRPTCKGRSGEVSVPLTRDSVVDSELLELAREFPEDTNNYIHELFDDESVVRYPRGKNVKKHKTFLHENEPKFYGISTTKSAYKNWAPHNVVHYGEMPVLSGSIIFPSQSRNMESEMRHSYQGEQTKRIPLMKGKENNLKCEGARDFLTVQRDSYRQIDEPLERTKPIIISNSIGTMVKQPFYGETQFMHDFQGHSNHRPPRAAKPVKSTINLKSDNLKDNFLTEHRAIYRGHNVKNHPIPEPFRKDPTEYVPPTEKFSTETVTKRDFQPLPLESLTAAFKKPDNDIIIPPGRVRSQDIKFQGQTTSKDAYKAYSSEDLNRLRYGEMPAFIGSILFPSQDKNIKSVTHESFQGEQTPRIPLMKGMPPNLTLEGSRDFVTVQRDSYKPRDEPVPRILPLNNPNPNGNVVIPSGNRTFYGVTSSKEFYKEWDPQNTKPIKQDFYGLGKKWTRPTEKLDCLTETHKSFVPPKTTERVESLKPIQEPVSNTGEQDFTTIYTKSYPSKPRYHLTKIQAELLKQQLKKKKAALARDTNGCSAIAVH